MYRGYVLVKVFFNKIYFNNLYNNGYIKYIRIFIFKNKNDTGI